MPFKSSVDWTITETYSFAVVYASPEKPRKHFLSPSISKEEWLPSSIDECEDVGAALMSVRMLWDGATSTIAVRPVTDDGEVINATSILSHSSPFFICY